MLTQESVMTTQEVASRFNEMAQKGQFEQILQELYADDAESIEPGHSLGLPSVRGKEAIIQKGRQWQDMVQEMHGGYSHEPQIAGNHFSLAMGMDVTMKGQERSSMDEICVYEVKDGKIVKEQFFY